LVEDADWMKQSNNEEINKVYLARFNPAHEHLKQPQGNSDQQLLRAWIRRKYHDKAWYKDSESGGTNNAQPNHAQPTIVKIPPKDEAPAPVDLLGSLGSSLTPSASNESSWDAFGGSSQSQQQQQAPAFNPSFPANFPSSPNNGFPANFGSSQTLQQQQANFANFSTPNSTPNQHQAGGFSNFNQAPSAPSTSQQQGFANFNQAQPSQQPFPSQQQQQHFANFNQQQPNAAQQHAQAGQQQGTHGFASFNQSPGQIVAPSAIQGQQQMPDPFARQGFGHASQQQVQQGMVQGHQQQPQNAPQSQPGQLLQQHSMPLPQEHQRLANQQQQFVQQSQQQFQPPQQQQQIYGQSNARQQRQSFISGSIALQTPMQQGSMQHGALNAAQSFTNQAPTTPSPQVQQQTHAGLPNQPQPTATTSQPSVSQSQPVTAHASTNVPFNDLSADQRTKDISTLKEPSSAIGKSKFSAEQLVIYKSDTGISSAKIVKVHFDDALDPFYTIVLENGKEKQTDDVHLEAQATLQSEVNAIIPMLTPVELKQVHEFLTQLKITPKQPTPNKSSTMEGVQSKYGDVEQNSVSAPNSSQSNSTTSSTPVNGIQPAAPTPAQQQVSDPNQSAAQFIPSPNPPQKPSLQNNVSLQGQPPQGQFPSNPQVQSMQGLSSPGQFQPNLSGQQGVQGSVPSHDQFHASYSGQGMQGTPQQGQAQPNQHGMQSVQPGFSQGNAAMPSFVQNFSNPSGQGSSGLIPSPPSMNNAVPAHSSGLPAPPLVQPTPMQQQQQFQQQLPQQQQQQFHQQPPQQQQHHFQPQPPQQFQQQVHNNHKPAVGSQTPNGGPPTSPMSPKGNPFDFY
jgi:hypothetical protein